MVQYSNHGKSLELTISWVEEYILGSCAHENVYLIVAGAIKSDTKYNLQVPRLGLMNQFATKVKVICIENIIELNTVLTECCKIQDMATENDVSRISTVIVLLGLFGHFDRTRSVGYSKDEVGEKEEDEEEDVLSDEKKFYTWLKAAKALKYLSTTIATMNLTQRVNEYPIRGRYQFP